jgi:16S rRNA (guanine527-N7)-methyltransferase
MTDAALARLAAAARDWGVPLEDAALAALASYLRFVQERNAKTNLTADDAWEDLALKHAADGLYAASLLRSELAGRSAPKILDLGSGAGFIGMALKLAWPEAEVALMEAVDRKYRFLSEASARLALPGLRVLHRRAGAAPPNSYEKDRDAVTARAVAPLPETVRLAAPLLAGHGRLAVFATNDPDPAEPALARALAATGLRLLKSVPYRRPAEDKDRRLVLFGRG